MSTWVLKEISLLVYFLAVLVSVCEAGQYCGSIYGTYRYCTYGCCGVLDDDCCTASVALIAGLCTGGAILIASIIVAICVCRRRRMNNGFVATTHQAQPVVTYHNQAGMISTAGAQPGVGYNPYQPYPTSQAYSNSGFTMPNQGMQYSQPKDFGALPPSYDAIANTSPGTQDYNYGNKN